MYIYKKTTRSSFTNYRGMHFNNQISKIAKGIIWKMYVLQLQQADGFGEREFAYNICNGSATLLLYVCFHCCWLRGGLSSHEVIVLGHVGGIRPHV